MEKIILNDSLDYHNNKVNHNYSIEKVLVKPSQGESTAHNQVLIVIKNC